ncbi:hypothetical protein LZ554_004120 [Drepanopeziza brunnea f. sp. 'monogermtubi']|nr:hypothetical protein LZ554_004120 [Drepanopeziza brunnea f. sp. 'monogermtubi']
MSTMQQRLQAASAQNTRLLTLISETEYAVSAYQQTQDYIRDLESAIADAERRLALLAKHVDKEYAEHRKFRDSHMRRLGSRLSGRREKFQEEASREEREWLDAVATQLKTRQGRDDLRAQMAEAEGMSAEFRRAVEAHERAARELDVLYHSLFGGPTPEIPEEDERERAVLEAEARYNEVGLLLSRERQARDLLLEANASLKRAFRDLHEVESDATMDVWGVGSSSFAELAEHSALSRCQRHVAQVELLVSQAQRIQPAMGRVGPMTIAQMDFVSSAVYDNIFSDMDMQERIRSSMLQLQNAQAELHREIGASDRRRDDVKRSSDELKTVLGRKRLELQTVRREAFEQACSQG